jgi:hypothetical protein
MSRAKYFVVFSKVWIPAFAGMTGIVVIFHIAAPGPMRNAGCGGVT